MSEPWTATPTPTQNPDRDFQSISMNLSLTAWTTIAEMIAAVGVVISLIYLARQVRQGNILTRYQARQSMMEKDLSTIHTEIENTDITYSFIKENPTEDELLKLHLFLTLIMRQREWEWFQYNDGIIDEEVYRTYHEVIAIILDTPNTRKWWKTVGRIGLNPDFVKEVDSLLANRELTGYWKSVKEFISSGS